ncbi:hypothetical protein EMCRGX_G012845 [Ephydatia muelleri]
MPSRNQKKRSKQQAEYLQKREDILSQENKAKARARYKADPEKKKASVRDTYKADPEKKASVRDTYKADPEKKASRYQEGVEENRAAKRQRYQEGVEENRAAKRQRYQEGVEENRAAKRRIYRGNSATIKAARRSRYWKGRRTTTTTQSYSLFEPNSRTLAEYGMRLEKAILRDSELLSEVNNAFCNSHPLLAQKVVTICPCSRSLLKTIRKVNAKKLQESDILVGHRFHTAGAEPYFFDNSKSVEENRAAKRQKYEDNSAAIKASERNRYWYDPAVRLAKRAAERKRYRRGHRTTTTTQRCSAAPLPSAASSSSAAPTTTTSSSSSSSSSSSAAHTASSRSRSSRSTATVLAPVPPPPPLRLLPPWPLPPPTRMAPMA